MRTNSLVFVTLTAMAACGDDGVPHALSSLDLGSNSPQGEESSAFGYHGPTGPAHWSELDPSFAACEDGLRQSPIALSSPASAEDLPDLILDYGDSHVSMLNNGHTTEYGYEPGSTVTLSDKTYELVQFHFHHRSEHTVDGEHAPLELHLVHRAADDEKLVIAVFLEEGSENPTLVDAAWSEQPSVAGQHFEDELRRFEASDLIPDGPAFRYPGSLTTPACSENVQFVVKANPITLSHAQLKQFTKLHKHNARPTQPLHGRAVSFGE